jgi:hypothetical protein
MLYTDHDNVTTTYNKDFQLSPSAFRVNHACLLTSGQCCIEQLVLYMRALHLMSSALQRAKLEMKAGILIPSKGMKNSE